MRAAARGVRASHGSEDQPVSVHLIWTTRLGSRIPIINMDDAHLMNAYRMCVRLADVAHKSYRFWCDQDECEETRTGMHRAYDNHCRWHGRAVLLRSEVDRRGFSYEEIA